MGLGRPGELPLDHPQLLPQVSLTSTICGLVLYDITDRKSFLNVQTWISEIHNYGQENMFLILIGIKIDLEDQRQVSAEDAKEFAENNGMMFFETCAMNPDIKECFKGILGRILDDVENGVVDPYDERNGIRVGSLVLGGGKGWGTLHQNKKKKKKGCCS